MAVRVRKLAKELRADAWDLVGVLHAIGFERYRTPQDMLPDAVVEKLRRAWSKGVRPVDVPRDEPAPMPAAPPATVPVRAQSLMEKVLPQVGGVSAAALDMPLHELAAGSEVALAELEAAREAVEHERAALASARATVAGSRASVVEAKRALDAEATALELARAELDAERAALAAERGVVDAARAEAEAWQRAPVAGLGEALRARGLLGADEFARTIVALSRAGRLASLLPYLEVKDPSAVRRILDDAVVLVDGDPGELPLLGLAAVAVAPDRAELPSADALSRAIKRLAEQMLLNGHRRAFVVGAPPLWARLLRNGLDPRVEIRFVPDHSLLDGEDAPRRGDLVVGALDEDVQCEGRILRLACERLDTFLDGVCRRLAS